MWFQQLILIFFTCSFVFGEESFNHDFGVEFEKVFSSGTGICGSLRPWIQANYGTTNVDAPNPDSPQFVKPDTTFSCIFSEDFSMSNEGQLQLYVYLSFTTLLDQISVVAYKSQNNAIVGEIISSLDHSHINSDWNTLNITIEDRQTNETFDGFVAIVGRASSNSDILVDHIQYLPPSTCDESTTTLSFSTERVSTTTLSVSTDDDLSSCDKSSGEDDRDDDPSENCFIHNFDEGLSNVFTHGRGACAVMRSWIEDNYNSTDIEPFHIYANSFVRPDTSLSCILSTDIKMSAGGKLQLNVYMYLNSTRDQMKIIVYEIQSSGNINIKELSIGMAYDNFNQSTWNTLEIEIGGNGSFDGQIAISGTAASSSIILLDSIRILPPTSESEEIDYDDICSIYDAITYQCIEYEFGPSFDVMMFDNTNKICTGAETWILVQDVNNNYTIQPRNNGTPSCISSPPFPISSSGNLTVIVSIKSELYFDTILVALEMNDDENYIEDTNGSNEEDDDEDEIHSVAYNKLVTDDFNSDSLYELRLELKDIKKEYTAQITFVGFATEEATVAVHSFRFEPTSWDKGNCKSLIELRKQFIVGK